MFKFLLFDGIVIKPNKWKYHLCVILALFTYSFVTKFNYNRIPPININHSLICCAFVVVRLWDKISPPKNLIRKGFVLQSWVWDWQTKIINTMNGCTITWNHRYFYFIVFLLNVTIFVYHMIYCILDHWYIDSIAQLLLKCDSLFRYLLILIILEEN